MTYISPMTAIFFKSVIKVLLRLVWTCSDVDTLPVKNDTPSEGMDESEVDASDQRDDRNHEVEEGDATYRSQRPMPVRRPPDRYGEWVLSSIREMSSDA